MFQNVVHLQYYLQVKGHATKKAEFVYACVHYNILKVTC